MFLEALLRGVVVPAVVTGLVLAVLARFRSRAGRAAAPVIACGIAAGYAAGHVAVDGLPRLPPIEAWQWFFWLAIAGAAVTVLTAALRAPDWSRRLLEAALAVALPWLILLPLVRSEWSVAKGGAVIAGWALAALAFWWPVEALYARAPAPYGAAILWSAAAAASVSLLLAASAKFGQLTGSLAAVFGAVLVAGWIWPAPAPTPGALGPAALVFLGLVLSGVHWSKLPPESAVLLAAGPLAGLATRRLLVAKAGGRRAASIAGLAVAFLLLGAALFRASQASAPAGEFGY
jgi:hypothetical protein